MDRLKLLRHGKRIRTEPLRAAHLIARGVWRERESRLTVITTVITLVSRVTPSAV